MPPKLRLFFAFLMLSTGCVNAVRAGNAYLNPEINISAGSNTGVGDGIGTLHIGYKFDNGTYIQLGPAAIIPQSGDQEIELSGKAGAEIGPWYGEFSIITGEEFTFELEAGANFDL